jgi:2Fe-2S ferredoxin
VRLTLLPENVVVWAHVGDTILDAALENGVPLPHECGGNCACTTCHVHILQGEESLSLPEEVEQDRLLGAEGLERSSRLACQALFHERGEVTVRRVEEAVW